MTDRADDIPEVINNTLADWRKLERRGFIPWKLKHLAIGESFLFEFQDKFAMGYMGKHAVAEPGLARRVTDYISKEKRRARLDPKGPEVKFFEWRQLPKGIWVIRCATGKPRSNNSRSRPTT